MPLEILKQHLIDPEVCIRCNTCEETCPVGAITHDDRNYVVKAELCNLCMACISPCPTGSIDNWRNVPKSEAYSITEQLKWDELPPQVVLPEASKEDEVVSAQESTKSMPEGARGSHLPPWSAAHPYTNLYSHKEPITATVAGNHKLTESADGEVRHIVLDFGQVPLPVLEGQSIGILPPGTTTDGRPHHARQYSIASPRDGERPGYNNLSLTVKRVTTPHPGVASHYLCDLKKGDSVQVIGPFGSTFLMPNHPSSHLLMICTGTGSAPMRGMTEHRRRQRMKGGASGKLMLFFGARTKEELPYFGPLMSLPKDFIDVNFAFSRTSGQPKRYVQDAMRERSADVAALLRDEGTYVYVCGLKGMEDGVLKALADIATQHNLPWEPLWEKMKKLGRLHFETY